jgi:DNA-binding transcriptional ArsR family regulator
MELNTAVTALAALAQEKRLSIFLALVEAGPEGLAAGRIGELLDIPPATLSFHLKELARAGLLSARQDGRFIYYAADFERMAALMSYLTRNCCRGMPEECLTVMGTALTRCAPSEPKRKSRSKS